MAWIQVHQPDGATAYINIDQIVRIRPTDSPQANCQIDLASGGMQAATETADELMRLINPRGQASS